MRIRNPVINIIKSLVTFLIRLSNGGTSSCRDERMVAELTAELARHPLRQPEVTLETVGEQEDECSTLRQVSVAN